MDIDELYALFKGVVDEASVEFYLIGQDGRFGYVNEAAASSLGYSRSELLTMGLSDIDPDLGHGLREYLEDLKRRQRQHIETRHRTKDGRCVDKEIDGVFLSMGGRDYVCAFARDITKRNRMEAALRESEERYRDLFECASDLVQIVRPDGRFVVVNPAWRATFGYSEEEVSRLTIFDLIDPDCKGHCWQTFAEVLAKGRVERIDTSFKAKNGERIMIQGSANCSYENGVPSLVRCIFRNVTDEKQLQAQLLQSQKMEAVGRLTSGVAHDFNNLLTTILSYSELFLKRLPEGDPLTEALRTIRDAGIRGAALTRQLLTFSRHQVVDIRAVDLAATVESMATLVKRLIPPDIHFAVEAKGCDARILADQHQLEQVLLNLVINARDAMANGGTLIVSCTAECREQGMATLCGDLLPGRYAVLSVADTGEGMSREVQAQIFEPFFTTKAQGKGTGLGLATVYGIVKQHSGHLLVESSPGQGTVFRIYFPLVEAPVETVVVGGVLDRLEGSETILVVDDEPEILEVVRRLLEPLGYTVLTAASAREALEVAEQGAQLDLLLADVIIPGMNGTELAKRLLVGRPGMKVLFMSGYTDAVLEEQGIAWGGCNFISKPLSPGKLAGRLRKVLTG